MRSFSQSLLLVCLVVLPVFSFGQSTVPQRTADARAFPAPWRPAFGTQNGQLTNAQGPSIAGSQSNTDAQINTPAGPSVAPPANSPTSLGNITPVSSQSTLTASPAPTASGSTVRSNQDIAPSRSRDSDGDSNITRITKTMNMLPNKDGQIWREYDISPYTSRITNSENPQQAILDWILRETGTEMWFNQPMGILNADRNHIYVYHTPEIQTAVRRIVDRFVRTQAQVQTVDINLVTVENPNWRANVYSILQPVEVQSPGVEAWMVSKENAARLLSQLSRRGDFSQHSSGRLTAHDGQELVLEKTRPRQFVRSLRWVPNQIPNYQPLLTTINEGYRLEISSLSSLDNSIIEATIKCDVDQLEKLTTVKVDVPGAAPGLIQQMDLQIPQLLSWRLHERFRWPNDQVLLLSCGVVAKPDPQANPGGTFPRLFNIQRNRADALVFIEYRGPASQGQVTAPNGRPFSGRPNPVANPPAASEARSGVDSNLGWGRANR